MGVHIQAQSGQLDCLVQGWHGPERIFWNLLSRHHRSNLTHSSSSPLPCSPLSRLEKEPWTTPPWYWHYVSQWDYQQRYIYLKMPDSFHTGSNEVWQPQRIFYSLKQVFHVWNKMLDSTLKELEFSRCSRAGCHPRGACLTPSLSSAVNSAFLQLLKSDPREIEWHPLDGVFQQRMSESFYYNTYTRVMSG